MKFCFEPITSVEHCEEAAWIAEISCMFLGEFQESDFSWDEDALLESYAEALRHEGQIDDADYYISEPVRGVQIAKERLISEVRRILISARDQLDRHYPFEISGGGKLLQLKPNSQNDGVAMAYLWMSVFNLSQSEYDYLQAKENDLKRFHRNFDDLFEVIACYAISGRQESFTFCTGSCRSAPKLVAILTKLVRYLGSGSAKTYNQLSANQRRANEAGVDGISVRLDNGVLGRDAEMLLLQATVQKTDRRKKVVGVDARQRFRNFFVNLPHVALRGALVIPFDGNDIDQENCNDADCIYITRSELLRYMGRYPQQGKRRGAVALDVMSLKKHSEMKQFVKLTTSTGEMAIA